MAGVDRGRLAKLMGLTTSEHDGEALNALRMANRLLAESRITWAEILGSRSAAAPDYRTPPSKRRGAGDTARYGRRADQSRPRDDTRHVGDEIGDMLSALAARRHDIATMAFIASINDHWEKKGYLTGDQYQVIRRLYEVQQQGGGRGWRF